MPDVNEGEDHSGVIDENVLRKYISVRKLASHGEPGEREAAVQAMGRLEAKYAGIRKEADDYERRNQPVTSDTDPSRGATNAGDWASPIPKTADDWIRLARAVYGGVTDFASTVAQTQQGRFLADRVQGTAKMSRTGSILVTLKLDMDTYREATQLNALQKPAFRQRLHEIFDSQLDQLFGTAG